MNNQKQTSDKEIISLSDKQVARTWKYFAIVSISVSICLLVLFNQTAWSMISIWWRSETFAHCFLILPIVIWLIWDRRRFLRGITPKPEYRVLILLLGAGFLWLLGYLVDALVVQQIALVALIIFSIWIILGNQLTWAMAFPLLFLFFSVPMGENLVPNLMEITATFTVWMIELTGIPVYREGFYISLPTGDWSVVRDCSGVRYLIASVVLGSLFAYITYQSLLKRSLFILASILVPIFANGMRAYIIVMLGHFSDMKLATGVDHLIYGWIFFGAVIFILFSIGSIWRDNNPQRSYSENDKRKVPVNLGMAIKAGAVILLVTAIWPLLAYSLDQQQTPKPTIALQAPSGEGLWDITTVEVWDWKPRINGANEEIVQLYSQQERSVSLYIGQYFAQKQGAELVSDHDLLVDKDNRKWRITSSDKTTIRLKGEKVKVDQATIKGLNTELLVWHWYRLGDRYTANPYIAKLLEALARLTFSRHDAAKLIVATQIKDEKKSATDTLQGFLDVMLPKLEKNLDLVATEAK